MILNKKYPVKHLNLTLRLSNNDSYDYLRPYMEGNFEGEVNTLLLTLTWMLRHEQARLDLLTQEMNGDPYSFEASKVEVHVLKHRIENLKALVQKVEINKSCAT